MTAALQELKAEGPAEARSAAEGDGGRQHHVSTEHGRHPARLLLPEPGTPGSSSACRPAAIPELEQTAAHKMHAVTQRDRNQHSAKAGRGNSKPISITRRCPRYRAVSTQAQHVLHHKGTSSNLQRLLKTTDNIFPSPAGRRLPGSLLSEICTYNVHQ